MVPPESAIGRLAAKPGLMGLAATLLGVRFIAPSLVAYLGVAGVDTTGLDNAFTWYSGLLPFVLLALLVLVVVTWPRGFPKDLAVVVASALVVAVALLWASTLDPGMRLISTPWLSLVLGVPAAAAIVAWDVVLERRAVAAGATDRMRIGLRSLGVGYALAFLLWSARFVDYAYELGLWFPSILTRLFDYGPTLLLSFLSIAWWFEIAMRPAKAMPDWLVALAPPVGLSLVGLALSQGLGGFLLSHVLTWGGSYALWAPTSQSLSIVGFAIGSFAATAWRLRARIPRPAWRLVVGGILCTALAGIMPFGGTLPSLSGILLGLVLVARGLADVKGAPPGPEPH